MGKKQRKRLRARFDGLAVGDVVYISQRPWGSRWGKVTAKSLLRLTLGKAAVRVVGLDLTGGRDIHEWLPVERLTKDRATSYFLQH